MTTSTSPSCATATQAVLNGAEMIAAGRDRTFPAGDGYWPATGAIVAALEYATERTARSVGKPDVLLFETALDRLGPGRSLMVGDRLDADLGGAAAAGHRRRDRPHRRDHARPGRGGRGSRARRRRREPVRPGDRVTLSLIVNPFAGGGRAARELSGVEAALRGLGLEHHVERTRSLDHARELALAAAQAGETAVAFGGDGLIGAVADALRHTDGVLGVLPGGRGNDFARMLGIPRIAAGRPARSWPTARSAGSTSASSATGRSSGSPAAALTRWPTGSPTRPSVVRGRLVYAYGAAAGAGRLAPGDVHRHASTAATPRTLSGYTVAAANSRYYGGGMMLAPDATLQDGMLDVVIDPRDAQAPVPAAAPAVFTGAHVRLENVEVLRGRTIEIAASRPFTMYADGDPDRRAAA